jgi:uncharacterized Fe-S cluster-containing protein
VNIADKNKMANMVADRIMSELKEKVSAISLLHPMEQKKIREIIRYQAIKCMEEMEAFK